MNLYSKNPHDTSRYFWVEDYTPEDKAFFESLGFVEVPAPGPASFGFKPTLEKKGTGLFGAWTPEEGGAIDAAVFEEYGPLTVLQYVPN